MLVLGDYTGTTMNTQPHHNESECGRATQADAELLSLFADHRDEAAFAKLGFVLKPHPACRGGLRVSALLPHFGDAE